MQLSGVSLGVLHWSRAYLHVQGNWVIRLRTFILTLQPGFPKHTCYGVCLFQRWQSNIIRRKKALQNLRKITLVYLLMSNSKVVFFHIAEFLSLQEGKVYRPQTSRISWWMACSQSDFYEQIDKLIKPEKTPDGLYLDDFASFWVPNSGLNIGQMIRILWCPSYKSSYPVFEWKDSSQEKGSTSICIRCWTHLEVGLK